LCLCGGACLGKSRAVSAAGLGACLDGWVDGRVCVGWGCVSGRIRGIEASQFDRWMDILWLLDALR
jgi:hypothetical protein